MFRSPKHAIAIAAMALLFLGACGSSDEVVGSESTVPLADGVTDGNESVESTQQVSDGTSEREIRLSTDGGFIVSGGGVPADEGDPIEIDGAPRTGLAPGFLGGLAGLNISRVSESLDQEGTYEYQVDFTADVSYNEQCASVVSAAADAGYDGFDNCVEGGDASLDNAGGSKLKYLTINDERAVIILSAPSSDSVDDKIGKSAPTWLTLPSEPAVEMQRTVYGNRIVTQYDYASQGNFKTLCYRVESEASGKGFERTTSKTCDATELPSVSFKNGPTRLKISNAYEPLMRYETQLNLEEWAKETGVILPSEEAPTDEEADPVQEAEGSSSESTDSESTDSETAESDGDTALACSAANVGVNPDGSVCKGGELVAIAPTGKNPIELGDLVDNMVLNKVSTSVEEDGTYGHQLDFDTAEDYEDFCRRFVAISNEQGYIGRSNSCDGEPNASFKRDADGSTLRFIPIKDGRATITFKAPSANNVAEIVEASVPSWSTQPAANPVKLERIVSNDKVDLEIDYANDGAFVEHCQLAVSEAEAQGFTVSTTSSCGQADAVSLTRSNLTLRVTNAYEPLITYKYLVDLES